MVITGVVGGGWSVPPGVWKVVGGEAGVSIAPGTVGVELGVTSVSPESGGDAGEPVPGAGDTGGTGGVGSVPFGVGGVGVVRGGLGRVTGGVGGVGVVPGGVGSVTGGVGGIGVVPGGVGGVSGGGGDGGGVGEGGGGGCVGMDCAAPAMTVHASKERITSPVITTIRYDIPGAFRLII